MLIREVESLSVTGVNLIVAVPEISGISAALSPLSESISDIIRGTLVCISRAAGIFSSNTSRLGDSGTFSGAAGLLCPKSSNSISYFSESLSSVLALWLFKISATLSSL